MKADRMVAGFIEDWKSRGEEFALRRLQQKLPFCSEVAAVAATLASLAAEVGRLRRVCILLIALAATAIAVSVVVLLDPQVPSTLRTLYCFVSSAGLLMAFTFIRRLPRLKTAPFLAAAECSLLYLCPDLEEIAED